MTKQTITAEKEKAFDKAIECLNNGNEKEAYELLKGINDKLRAMLEDEEFCVEIPTGSPDFLGEPNE